MIEDTFDRIMEDLKVIERKLEEKAKNKYKIKVSSPKNSQIHFLINTDDKNKLMKKAEEENLDFSEWCRRKLLGNS
ncbi:MAG: hypothetical protein OQK82_03475 [Candidatus Pacearchaeota archaeon]|nr:hypothetical protein [Candidatus Pacearchaeota archaeon]